MFPQRKDGDQMKSFLSFEAGSKLNGERQKGREGEEESHDLPKKIKEKEKKKAGVS